MKKYILNIIILLISGMATAQIEDGSLAPNFVVSDIDGETHDLYSYLQEGHFVVLFFMATWSDPCWSYHNGAWNGTDGQGAMNVLYNEHSVDNGGNVIVLMVEGDPATNTECVVGGPGCNYTTHGNWAMDTPYPIINNAMIADLYGIGDYPIIMTICPNGFVSESGTLTGAGHWSVIQNYDCPELLANDAGLQINPNSSCEETELTVDIVNLGTDSVTALNIVSTGITPEVNMDWTGNLGTLESETISFGFVTAIEGEEMMLSITDVDEDMNNNDVVPTLGAVEGSTHIHLELQSDTYPEDFSFYIYNEFGDLVVNDGGWGDLGADVLIERDYFLPELGCYTLQLFDSYGDGLLKVPTALPTLSSILFNDIKKHKLDVFRLGATLNSEDRSKLPMSIKSDLKEFIGLMKENPPQLDAMLKHMGITPIASEELLSQLKSCFGL